MMGRRGGTAGGLKSSKALEPAAGHQTETLGSAEGLRAPSSPSGRSFRRASLAVMHVQRAARQYCGKLVRPSLIRQSAERSGRWLACGATCAPSRSADLAARGTSGLHAPGAWRKPTRGDFAARQNQNSWTLLLSAPTATRANVRLYWHGECARFRRSNDPSKWTSAASIVAGSVGTQLGRTSCGRA